MSGAVVYRSRVGNFEALVLENARLRAVVLPELGGRVWELEDRIRGRQWIWHREGVPLAVQTAGAAYDEVWAGGWEELFPNDAPASFEGRILPDHGEWWTLPWTVDASSAGEEAVVHLSATSSVVKATCAKVFRLPADAATLDVTYGIRSKEPLPFHFLFKQHLPIALTPSCRLQLPGGQVEAVDPSFGTWLPGPGPFTWPLALREGRERDLRSVPPREAAEREFVYVTDLPEPWCGVDDLRCRASLRMDFEADGFPFLWLFLSYGGWRETYTAVLEPCTNMPKDLEEAVRRGQSAHLLPGAEFRTTVSVTLGGVEEGS